MKVANSLPANLAALKGAEIYTHGHLPVAAAYCRRLGLVDIVNNLVPSQMQLKPGLVVQAMVLDTLSGRTPLYHSKDFMANQDIELLLGTFVKPGSFNDTNLGRSLDAIFEAGPSKIVSTLGVRASREFALDAKFETSVTLYKKKYRALVVYSSSHDKRRQKRLDKSIAESAQSINDQLAKIPTQYFCEADAKAASQRVEALSGNLHVVKATISTHEVRKPGRPPVDKPAPTNTRYVVSWELALNTDAVEQEKLLAGCFVLLTNVPIAGENGMDEKKLLLTYKGQYGVESDFAFLKDPIVVNNIFFTKPHRIDALGMILVIALMVYRLMERTMRNRLKETKKEIVGWKNEKPINQLLL